MPSLPPNKLRAFAVAFLVVAAVGFVDATYLTIEHYANRVPPCFITSGCDTVTTSSYATVAGVPVALAGALYYLVMIIGSAVVIETKQARWLRYLAVFSLAGLGSTVYLVSIMAFVLKAWCIYCLGSAVTSLALFVIGAFAWRKTRTPSDYNPAQS